MIYVVNYSDHNFEKSRKFSTKTAYRIGKADLVLEYGPKDIDCDFFEKNKNIFSYKRGAGLWLWKPYIIKKALSKINKGDYLFYSDAGTIYVNRIQYLVDSMEKNNQNIMLFETPLLAKQFTKKETFYLMDYLVYDANQILATYLLVKKNDVSESFISQWLKYCCDERILSPQYFVPQIKEFDDFIAHREDQSVLSILARKHNLPVFRDPSDYGIRPWQFAAKDRIYAPKKYPNSNYPKIILSNRRENPIIYFYKERIKTILNKLGLYTQGWYFKKHGVKNEN